MKDSDLKQAGHEDRDFAVKLWKVLPSIVFVARQSLLTNVLGIPHSRQFDTDRIAAP